MLLSYKASIGKYNWMQRMSSAEDEELEDMDEVTRKIFLTWVSRMNKTSHQSLV
jgi:hypothetical protein